MSTARLVRNYLKMTPGSLAGSARGTTPVQADTLGALRRFPAGTFSGESRVATPVGCLLPETAGGGLTPLPAPPVIPTDPPTGLAAVPDDEEVVLTWNDDGTPGFVRYEYRVDGGTPVSTGSVEGATVTGLTNGVEYLFQVRVVTTTGTSQWSLPVASTPYGFDPLTTITWTVAVWASDPLWTPPADGGAVSSWRDGSGNGRDLVHGAAGCVFRASGINGMPTVQGNGVGTLVSSVLTQAQPCTLICIGTQPGSSGTMVSGRRAPGSGNLPLVYANGTSAWYLYGGSSSQSFGSYATTPVLVGGVANGASSKGLENNSSTGLASPGTASCDGMRLFSYSGVDAMSTGHVAFAGIYNGDITADPEWATWKAWASATYGLGF